MKHPIVTALILAIFSQSSLALKEKKKDFFYFRKEIRVQLLNDLQKSLQTNYSLWNLKKERLDDFDPSTLFQEMIQKEQKIIDPPDKLQRAKLTICHEVWFVTNFNATVSPWAALTCFDWSLYYE